MNTRFQYEMEGSPLMPRLLIIVLALLFIGQPTPSGAETNMVTRHSRELRPTGVPSEKVRTKLSRILIPILEFRGATAAEALQFLARKAELSLSIKRPAEQRVVTMKAVDITLIDAIDRSCAAAGLSWRYTDLGIEVGVPEAFAPK